MSSQGSHTPGVWRNQASQWDRIGPPLRPSPPDLAHHEDVIRRVAAVRAESGEALRAVALGATPEHAAMAWPAGTSLLAIDKSAEMIERVWPGFPRPGEGARVADWLAPPDDLGPFDVVVSDGPFGVLRHPVEHARLLAVVRDWLSPPGRFTFRVFVRPERRESPGELFAALSSGSPELTSFHAFKLRLLMAVQSSTRAGVRVGDVWQIWHDSGPDPSDLIRTRGFTSAQIGTIDAYRDSDSVYCFPTLAELRATIAESGLVEESCSFPDYPLGERCPRFVLARPR